MHVPCQTKPLQDIHNLMPGASLLVIFNTFFKTLSPHQLKVPDRANLSIFHEFIVLIGFLNRKNTFWHLYSVKIEGKATKIPFTDSFVWAAIFCHLIMTLLIPPSE